MALYFTLELRRARITTSQRSTARRSDGESAAVQGVICRAAVQGVLSSDPRVPGPTGAVRWAAAPAERSRRWRRGRVRTRGPSRAAPPGAERRSRRTAPPSRTRWSRWRRPAEDGRHGGVLHPPPFPPLPPTVSHGSSPPANAPQAEVNSSHKFTSAEAKSQYESGKLLSFIIEKLFW